MNIMSKIKSFIILFLAVSFISMFPPNLKAESINTEPLFKDIFITAGYTALLGGLLGTSAMFIATDDDEPLTSNVRWVGLGASLGFFGGTILGSYLAFGPIFVADTPPALFNIADNQVKIKFPTVSASLSKENPNYYAKLLQASF